MSTVGSRDLRNHTVDVRRRVAAGDPANITVNGAPVAELIPPSTSRRAYISREYLDPLLMRYQADAGLRSDVDALTGETTDDLDAL